MHALSLYHIPHKYPILFKYFFVVFFPIHGFYDLYFIEMYLVDHRWNSHSNQDTQTSIESYHVALKH